MAFSEVDNHEKGVVVESLAVDFAAHGRRSTRRGNLYFFAKLPSVGRAHAGAVRIDIVSVGPFVPSGVHELERHEVDGHDDRESSFFSACKAVVPIPAPWPPFAARRLPAVVVERIPLPSFLPGEHSLDCWRRPGEAARELAAGPSRSTSSRRLCRGSVRVGAPGTSSVQRRPRIRWRGSPRPVPPSTSPATRIGKDSADLKQLHKGRVVEAHFVRNSTTAFDRSAQ